MAVNSSGTPAFVYDNIGKNPTIAKPTTAYTAGAGDNVVICAGNSVAVTLASTSNSPIWVSSVDGTTQRTGCTIVANGANYVIADSGCAALCVRIGPASQNLWMIVGAKTAS